MLSQNGESMMAHDTVARDQASVPATTFFNAWCFQAALVTAWIICFGGCTSLSQSRRSGRPSENCSSENCSSENCASDLGASGICVSDSCALEGDPVGTGESCPSDNGCLEREKSPLRSALAAASCTSPGMPSCAAGCCTSATCVPAPMDYAPVAPMAYNAYGIDPNEFLCNGGDRPPTAIVNRNDAFEGLNPPDTVVHYTTESQDIELSASNQVCLYAPRFSSVRKVTGAVAGQHAIGLSAARHRTIAGGVEIKEGGVTVEDTIELAHAEVTKRIDAMRDRNRGVPMDAVQQVVQQTDVLAALAGIGLYQLDSMAKEQHTELQRYANAAVAWTIDASVEAAISDVGTPAIKRAQAAEGFTVYDFPDAGRLEILKLADRHDALPGEKVNFAITVRNVGDSPVTEVTLSDNLTTRLDYVPESQTCSGGAEFETAANEVGSQKLTWKLTDQLRVGESVTIRFECVVR